MRSLILLLALAILLIVYGKEAREIHKEQVKAAEEYIKTYWEE